ncbi:APC family permease [Dysosmobacter sp.]|uniref:APC family permease n=1 Tax=Dysosmobacter sp. TaxID=2591382 RepID=UPI002A8DDCC1|nr:APC family permease [Dysosmobacter sp.]MDY3985678.1 APC family permease [Dysosmobacter sp.]
MDNQNGTKLKRVLGFGATYGAAMGLVVSGTAMFSVTQVAGQASHAVWITGLIGLIPIVCAALAFSELSAMLPGGGMISDYTNPALGRFWGTLAVLGTYVLLAAADGSTQMAMSGYSLQEVTGIPAVVTSLAFLVLCLLINLFDVGIYGKFAGILPIGMMIAYAILAVTGAAGVGESMGIATPVNNGFLPAGGWGAVFGAVGSSIWWYIGFENCCPMAEETKEPYKVIPRALFASLITIYAIDIVFSYASLKYTDINILLTSGISHIEGSKAMMGQIGAVVMSTITILASFTTANSQLAALPRMFYGLARQEQLPKVFGYIHPKYRVPIWGTVTCFFLMFVCTIYICAQGGTAEIMNMFINIVCVAWLGCYILAMLDVLVLRKKYPDFPRLFKVPAPKLVFTIGIIGSLYAIYTISDYILFTLAWLAVVVIFIIVWNRAHKRPINEVSKLEDAVIMIRERTEYLPVWDEAVVEWLKSRNAM